MTRLIRIAAGLSMAVLFLAGGNCADGLDTSALPAVITVKEVSSTRVGELIHDITNFWSGDLLIMSRDLWLTVDRAQTVRMAHTLYDVTLPPRKEGEPCVPVTPICTVYHLNQPFSSHSILTQHIPTGCTLLTSDADEASPRELRLSCGQQVLLSVTIDQDGRMTPRTQTEFDRDMKKRYEALSSK